MQTVSVALFVASFSYTYIIINLVYQDLTVFDIYFFGAYSNFILLWAQPPR